MRISRAVLFAAGFPALFAQMPTAVSGCEPRPEVRKVLDEKLSGKALANMKLAERVAFRRGVLEDLIAKYPDEVEPHRRLIQSTKQEDTGNFAALVDRYRKGAEQNPNDPLALYFAGLALSGRDTPLSIKLLEQARAKAPDFPWPALELARIYSPGAKGMDKKKASDEAAAFFAACPSSTDQDAQWRLTRAGTPELTARVAAALRARLAGETDPQRLQDYEILWGLEFRTHPPTEHNALRKQVAADVKRLQTANPKPDAAWLVFLKNGYKQSGASPEVVIAMENRVIEAFPHSEESYRIVSARWENAHKEPEDQADALAWKKYHAEYREALKGWMARFTESRELQHEDLFEAIYHDPDLSPEVGIPAMDDFLAEAEYQPRDIGHYLWAAGFLIDHKWQPKRVFDMLQDWDKLMDQSDVRMLGDNLGEEMDDVFGSNSVIRRQAAVGYLLVAARLTERPPEAERLKAYVERDLPPKSWPHIETQYWTNRARLAALEGSRADALTYYQKALHARKQPPRPEEGRVTDDLVDEARALWKQLGGSESAWNLWSKPPAAKIQELAEIGWEKPKKDMPAFELADLSGKTWRLKDLAGRAVLINVWATWCGPCKAELPHLAKLYEKVKDRKDLQILTLTVDEDPGQVAPFLKEKGYAFPALPALAFVTDLLGSYGIPQNWIVDPRGVWRWTGGPGGSDAEWEDAVLRQLESVK
ncbi:MAG TPA: TlpA disulfide reductase family protein [Bryobacteraceae bacterium]|nr:TlpA disulfide reductase family protein [Bryobacteraceae bacterium]